MKKLTFIILIATLGFGCDESVSSSEWSGQIESDYIIFGHFYGFCGGENCIEIFKLTREDLFEDTNDFYPNSDQLYNGKFKKLDQAQFDKLNNLNFNVPTELLNQTQTIIGAPDAADGGGLYFQLSDGRFWLIDMNEESLPEYLHPLRNQIRLAISLINE
ncbi:hypothetical protein [Reichenbachiella sp.]|uniref:hypothetical protein n=1 Tax=Reichenbachiella sp. TaxID=2184521 RepID=UPI003BAF9A83